MPDERATYSGGNVKQPAGGEAKIGRRGTKDGEGTPEGCLRVASATEAVERRPDRGAEVSRGHSRS